MSTQDNDVKVIVSADVARIKPALDSVNAQLRGMAEKSVGVTGETSRAFSTVETGATRASQRIQEVSRSFNTASAAASASSGIFSKNAYAIQNASYQVTDFITQVQNGTRVSIALGQQLPQLLAGFGAMGAVFGMVASLTPAVVQFFSDAETGAKNLESSTGNLARSIGEVGKASRDISMDKLYEEYNRANAITRTSIIEQVRFQQTLIETQRILAQQALGKSLSGIGDYGFMDRMKGVYGSTPAEKLADEYGVALDTARDMLPAIKGLRDDSEDASNFIARFGIELAKSGKGSAQQLLKDIKAVADGSREAAAAQTRLSEAMQKMTAAGSSDVIDIQKKSGKSKTDPFPALNERVLDRVDAAQMRATDQVTGFETKNLERVSALRMEIELLGKSADEVAEAKALAEIDRQFEASRLQVEKYLGAIGDIDGIDRLTGELSRAAEVAKGEMVSALSELKKKQDALNASWEVGADRALRRYRDQATNVAAASEQAFNRAFSSMEDALVEFAMTGKLNFSNMANSIIADIIRIQARAAITQAMGGSSSGLGGLFGNLLGGLFGGRSSGVDTSFTTGLGQNAGSSNFDWTFNALGNVYRSPSLSAYSGQVYNSPQVFAFAKGAGIFAEAGPEAIMPLQRDSRGRLGVSAGGGGASLESVRVEIRNEGTPQEVTRAQPRFDAVGLIVEVFTRDIANEGPMAKSMQSRFGLSRAAGAFA
ncbi:MAG: phage tail tape measure protein [Dechloromonas sp.]|nr:phage tail tape measure protein [Dechloromonas sp.]